MRCAGVWSVVHFLAKLSVVGILMGLGERQLAGNGPDSSNDWNEGTKEEQTNARNKANGRPEANLGLGSPSGDR